MPVRTLCPCCSSRVPARHTWTRRLSDWRRCPQCDALLVRVSTDEQPWTTFIALGVMLPALLSPLAAWWLWERGLLAAAVLAIPTGIFLAYVINHLQFPYTNAYVVWRPICDDCGYDLQGRPTGHCPECGGQPTQHPEA